MGFCRRCGDIVAGERCKCGGTANGEWQVFAWRPLLDQHARPAGLDGQASREPGLNCLIL